MGSTWRRSAWCLVGLCGLVWCAAPAMAQDDLRMTPVVRAVQAATPSVVTIEVEVAQQSPFSRRTSRAASAGSGVVLTTDGVVLTNAHVVDGAVEIKVYRTDGPTRPYLADVIAMDRDLDLAVLRVQRATDFPAAALGQSQDLLLGEPAIAIGNPFGLGLTVSTGVVASVARDVNVGSGPRQSYIQTDAAINPGNSGGALVNIHGELIGINTFIQSGAEGVGFAIPIHRARKVALDLLAYGSVQVPWLGVTLGDGSRGGRPVPVVLEVRPGGPAAQMGIVRGEWLRSVDGHAVQTRADVNARLAEQRPGASVGVVVGAPGAKPRAVQLTTARAPATLGLDVLREVMGVQLRPVEGGLEVVAATPGGVWARQGLKSGDVLVAIDGRRVASLDAAAEVLSGAAARHRLSVYLWVARGAYSGGVEMPLVATR